MINLRTSTAAPLSIDIEITLPIVYLDYCVIIELSKNDYLGQSVKDILLEKNGTLCWSWAHLLELSSLGLGETYSKAKSYLASFGANIVLMEIVGKEVIQREKKPRPWKVSPQIDYEFVEATIKTWDRLSSINLGIILQEFEDNPSSNNKWKLMHQTHKKNTQDLFLMARSEYMKNPKSIEKYDRALASCSTYPPHTEYIQYQLMKECIITNEAFNESDGIDFEHSVVSTAYSDFVVLDKKWARRLRNISLPPETAKIFSVVEIEQFLNELKTFNENHPLHPKTS